MEHRGCQTEATCPLTFRSELPIYRHTVADARWLPERCDAEVQPAESVDFA
jgi:hypothetical protein